MPAESRDRPDAVATVDVSVVIPCYRCIDTIERAVASVAAQTVRPREVILGEDHSPDGTLARLYDLQRRYGAEWIKVIPLPENRGAASARQAAWDAARGRYVAFLDADDSWHPRKLEVQVGWMEKHPEVRMTSHLCVQVSGEPGADPPVPEEWEARQIRGGTLLLTNQLDTRTVMLRREITQRFDTRLRYGEDYLLWLEVVLAGGLTYRLELPLAYFYKARYGEGGMSALLWKMELGELHAYRAVRRLRLISAATYAALIPFSLAKYARRVLVVRARRLMGRPAGA